MVAVYRSLFWHLDHGARVRTVCNGEQFELSTRTLDQSAECAHTLSLTFTSALFLYSNASIISSLGSPVHQQRNTFIPRNFHSSSFSIICKSSGDICEPQEKVGVFVFWFASHSTLHNCHTPNMPLSINLFPPTVDITNIRQALRSLSALKPSSQEGFSPVVRKMYALE